MTENVGRAVFALETDTSKLNKGFDDAETMAKKRSQGIAGVVKATIGPALGAGLGAGAAMLGSAFNDLENSMATAGAQAGWTTQQTEKLTDANIDLSKNTLQSQEAIAGVMGNLTALQGVEADNVDMVSNLSKKYLDWSTVTGQDAATAVAEFDDALDAWNLTAADAPGLMDRISLAHQRYGVDSEKTLVALNKLGPAFQGLGLSIDTSLGYINAFARKGIDAESTGTAFNKALALLTDTSEAANNKINDLGVSLGMTEDQLAALRDADPATAFNMLAQAIGSTEDPGKRAAAAMDLFGTRAGGKFSEALYDIYSNGGSIDQFIISEQEAAGETEDAANKIEGTFTNKLKLLGRQIKGTAMDLTKDFAPAFQVAGVAGKPLAGLIGGLGGQLVKLIPGLFGSATGATTMAGGETAATGATMGLNASMLPMLLTFGLIVLALAAIGIGIYLLIKHWDDIRAFLEDTILPLFNKVKTFIIDSFNQVLNWVKQNWPLLLAIIMGPIGLIVFGVIKFKDDIIRIFGEAWNAVKGIFNDGVSAIQGAAQSVLNWFSANWPIVATLISGPFFPLVALATDAFGVRSALVGAFEGVLGFLGGLPGRFYAVGAQLGEALWNGIKSAIGDVGDLLPDVSIAGVDITPWHTGAWEVPGLQDGWWNVPGVGNKDTVPSMLTPGEMVIPADLAGIIRDIVSGSEGAGAKEVNITVNNPQPAAAEESLHRQMLNMSYLGI